MDRIKVNFWLDILMLVVFIVVAVTSILLFFDIGLRHDDLESVHEYLGLALIFILAVHFLLHFNWIAYMIRKPSKS